MPLEYQITYDSTTTKSLFGAIGQAGERRLPAGAAAVSAAGADWGLTVNWTQLGDRGLPRRVRGDGGLSAGKQGTK